MELKCFSVVLGLVLGRLVLPDSLAAQSETSTYDDIWRFAEWYDNPENASVQQVLFSGRFQYEYASVDDDDVTYTEWNVRRLRLGVRSELFNQFTLHAEAEFNPQERNPFYKRFTDFYLEWSRGAPLAVTVGKQGVPFTIDGSTSSKELLTIDRSNLANNMWFPQEYVPGISFSGEASNWVYQLGGFSSGAGNREFGEFNGSAFTLAAVGYDFADAIGVDQVLLRGNYVYQSPDPLNTFTRQLQHIGSVNLKLEAVRWGIRGDVSAASGYRGQSDLLGTMIMPFLNLTTELQVVGRYTYLSSEDANGIRLARYESERTGGRGDRYSELYLGANYFFHGHKLKLQSGLQLADMNDVAADGGAHSGVSFATGLRMSW